MSYNGYLNFDLCRVGIPDVEGDLGVQCWIQSVLLDRSGGLGTATAHDAVRVSTWSLCRVSIPTVQHCMFAKA